ncbi:MAG TPA: hypothetical protein VIL74_08990 [Pyrinomonadaceae bacterium]
MRSAECAALVEKEEWKKRFLSEVAGNRKREDAHAAIIRTLAKAPGFVPAHSPLTDEPATEADEPQGEQPTLSFLDEEAVLYVARQFKEQNPEAYGSDEAFAALCQKIRDNPELYT